MFLQLRARLYKWLTPCAAHSLLSQGRELCVLFSGLASGLWLVPGSRGKEGWLALRVLLLHAWKQRIKQEGWRRETAALSREAYAVVCASQKRVVCFPNLAPGKLQKVLSFSSYLSLGSISQQTKESLVGKSYHTFRGGCGKLFSI